MVSAFSIDVRRFRGCHHGVRLASGSASCARPGGLRFIQRVKASLRSRDIWRTKQFYQRRTNSIAKDAAPHPAHNAFEVPSVCALPGHLLSLQVRRSSIPVRTTASGKIPDYRVSALGTLPIFAKSRSQVQLLFSYLKETLMRDR